MTSTARRQRALAAVCFAFIFWLVFMVVTVNPPITAVFLALVCTALTCVFARTLWTSFGPIARSYLDRVPNLLRGPERVIEMTASNLLRHAPTSAFGKRMAPPRGLVVGISPADLAELLATASQAEIESYLTRSYRKQLTAAAQADPQSCPLVTIVALPGLARGRSRVWTADAVSPLHHPDLPTDMPATRSFDADETVALSATDKDHPIHAALVLTLRWRDCTLTNRGSSDIHLGRHRGCEFVIDDPAVSATHARAYRNAGGWMIEDAGSRHGLFVDGHRVQAMRLHHGMTFVLGPRTDSPAVSVSLMEQADTQALSRG